jgi:hypothetical protein
MQNKGKLRKDGIGKIGVWNVYEIACIDMYRYFSSPATRANWSITLIQAPPFSFHKPVELVIAPPPPARPLQHSVYCILIDMRHATRRHVLIQVGMLAILFDFSATLLSICDTQYLTLVREYSRSRS